MERCGIPCRGGKRAPGCTTCRFVLDPEGTTTGEPKRGDCGGEPGWRQVVEITWIRVEAKTKVKTIPLNPSDGQPKKKKKKKKKGKKTKCQAEWDRFKKENDEHERERKENCEAIAKRVQKALRRKLVGRKVEVCARNRASLADALADEVERLAGDDLAQAREEYNQEPHQPTYPDCDECPCPKGGGSVLASGSLLPAATATAATTPAATATARAGAGSLQLQRRDLRRRPRVPGRVPCVHGASPASASRSSEWRRHARPSMVPPSSEGDAQLGGARRGGRALESTRARGFVAGDQDFAPPSAALKTPLSLATERDGADGVPPRRRRGDYRNARATQDDQLLRLRMDRGTVVLAGLCLTRVPTPRRRQASWRLSSGPARAMEAPGPPSRTRPGRGPRVPDST